METTRDLGCAELWAKSLEQSLARRGRPRRASVELYRLKPERDLASTRPLAESSAYWQIRRTAAERAAMPLTTAGSGAALALLAATTLPTLLGGGRGAGATIHAKAVEPARAPGKLGAAIARALTMGRHRAPASQVSASPRGVAAAAGQNARTAPHTTTAAGHTATAAAGHTATAAASHTATAAASHTATAAAGHTATAAAGHTASAGTVTMRSATAAGHTAGTVTASPATAAGHTAGTVTARSVGTGRHTAAPAISNHTASPTPARPTAAPAPASRAATAPAAARAVVEGSAAPVHANFAAAPDSGGAAMPAGATARTAAPSTRTAAPSTRAAAPSTRAAASSRHAGAATPRPATGTKSVAAHHATSAAGATGTTHRVATISSATGGASTIAPTAGRVRANPRAHTPARVTPRTLAPTTPRTHRGTTRPAASGLTGVQALQQRLGLTIDGDFGPMTKAAVERFQRAHGLTPNGIVGPGTRAALGLGPGPVLSEVGAAPAPAPTRTRSETATPTGGTSLASSSPSTGASAQIAAMVAAGNAIATRPYVYGGGHGSFDSYGYDCSGSVSYVLHAAGLLSSPEDSSGLESYGAPGPGRYVTIYANAGHAFMTIDGRRFDTIALQETGTRWSSTPGSASGYVVRHPVGL